MIAAATLLLAAAQTGGSLPSGTPTQSSLGGTYVAPYAAPLSWGALPGRMLQITMNFPGQTWQEQFIVGVPRLVQYPAPVLTLFHGYGEEPADLLQNTTLAQDAMARGWVVFVPLGAHKFNYGIEYAQENIERSFEFLSARLPIDMDRVYAAGFSMGGGAAASYAARHLDPEGIRFAALVNHTGTTSLRSTYHTSNDTNLFRSPLMFGATPDENPFVYQQCSTVDLDPFTGALDLSGEMAPNLAHIPTRHWNAEFDANTSILDQTAALHDRLGALGGDTAREIVQSSVHTWSTLDTTAVLDWLGAQRLSAPAPGDVVRTIADRDGRWHALEIEQAAAGAFSPILWSAQPALNTLYLIEMANVERVSAHIDDLGLDEASPLTFVIQTTDASSTEVVIEGIAQAPTQVRRRGAAAASWVHDPVAGTLTIREPSLAGWSNWTVIP